MMKRLPSILILVLCCSLASGQWAWFQAPADPETTTNPSLEHPDVLWIAADGSVDKTPTVLAGEIAAYEILDDSLPEGWSFNTSTGQLTCADVGSSAFAGTIKIRAKNEAFVDIESTPNEYAEIRQRYHIYTSTDTISTADTFPFIANTSGCLYTVTEPITVDGSWLAITGNVNYVGIKGDGNTITYDNGDTVIDNPGFETAGGSADLADGWDFSNAASAERFEGDYVTSQVAYNSEWSLRFAPQIGASEYVTNETEIELEPDTWYCLQVLMFLSGGSANCTAYVNLERQDEAGTIECEVTQTSGGAMKLFTTKFLTDEAGGTYVLVAGATNPDSDADYTAYIDSISVTRYRAMGIHVRTVDDELPLSSGQPSHPDIETFGTANGTTISDLVLTQGADAGFECHAIRDRNTSGAAGTHISHVTANLNGNDISAVYGKDISLGEIYANTFNNNGLFLTNRATFTGATINLLDGEICYNTFLGAPHCAYYGNSVTVDVHHNTFKNKSRYTNGFAVLVFHDEGSQIHHNTVDNYGDAGEYHGRGIYANNNDAGGASTDIYNNTIRGHEVALNQDYGGGLVIGGWFGIQWENTNDTSVRNNVVNAISDVNSAWAMRVNGNNVATNEIVNNEFNATRSGSANAGSLKLQGLSDVNILTIAGNTLSTDHVWIGDSWDCDRVILDGNILAIVGDGSTQFPMQVTWTNSTGNGLADMEFRDNIYGDATAETVMNKNVVNTSSGSADSNGELYVSWTTTIQVNDSGDQPIEGAAVVIEDGAAAEVFSGTTDSNGRCVAVLKEFTKTGSTETDHNDHAVTVTADGETFSPEMFTADSTQTITVTAE